MSPQRSQLVAPNQIQPASGAASAPDSSQPQGGIGQPLFRFDLVRSLQMHRRLALAFALGGLALAAAFLIYKWPVYIAKSQVYIQPLTIRLMETNWSPRWPSDSNTYDSFIEEQVQSASQPDVLVAALQKLPPGSWQQNGEADTAAAHRLGNAMRVYRIGTTYEIEISASSKRSELSAQIANAVANAMIEKVSRLQRAGDKQRVAILLDEQSRIQKELDSDHEEQTSINEKLGVAAIGTNLPDHYDDEIGKVHEELVKARTAHDEAAARLLAEGADAGASSKALNAEADEIIASDPGLSSLKLSLNQRRAVLVSQMANLTPNHPQYKQAAEELAQIDGALDSMSRDLRAKAAARMQQRLRNDLERTAGVETRLNAQIGQLSGMAAGATPKLQRASDLATDIVRLQTRRSLVDEQLHNLQLEDSVPGAASLAAAATPPLHPALAGIGKQVMFIAAGGILLGLFAALLASNLDQRVYIASDVEQVLGFAPIVQLPDFNEVSEGVVDEHLIRLASTLEHAYQQGTVKICIFTSAGLGAGVSTITSRLIPLLESLGRPSILVDAAWNPASRSSSFDGTLAGDAKMNEHHSRSTAFLEHLADESETAQDTLAITDAAPLDISAETEYLARFVDSAIVIVESGVTTRAQLRAISSTLQRLDVPAVGFVLNRVKLSAADGRFRKSVAVAEQYLSNQSRSFKQELEELRLRKKSLLAGNSVAPRLSDAPNPQTHIFYLPEWKATNPFGDVKAAKAEAIRLGYEVIDE